MANCPFCKDYIKEWNLKKKGYLIATQTVDDHVHVHGTLEKKALMKGLIETSIEHCDLTDTFAKGTSQKEPPKEVVFHNKQRIGDMLMFTCGVRDFKKAFPKTRVGVISTAMHVWDNNPNVDSTVVATEKNTYKIGTKLLTNASNRLDWHFANAFRVSIEDALGVSFAQGPPRPDVWLTEEEWNAPPIIKEPYWLICIGGEPGWGCKMYPYHRWQAFVEQNPDTLFYQIGTKEDDHPRLKGNNVVDYIGKTQNRDTGLRDLFKLFLNAEGSIGLVSFHMHLSAAFGKPCIVVAGAREPAHFTQYPGHQYLATDGCLPCADNTACWHCNIDTCTDLLQDPVQEYDLDKKVPRCVDIIYPEDITNALMKYYRGGRLKQGVQLGRPKMFKNIVKEAKIHRTSIALSEEAKAAKALGITFGGGALTENDWVFIKSVIATYKPQNFLEFGAGISTVLLNREGVEVTTYETLPGWIAKLKAENNAYDIRLWGGKTIKEPLPMFDMAFVDGPSGAQNREWSTKIASEKSDIVIVHDAGRENERRWQFRYLKDGFNLIARGGNRCHLWVRKGMYANIPIAFKVWSKPQQVHLDRIVDTPRATSGSSLLEVKPPLQIDMPAVKPVVIEAESLPTVKPNGKFVKFVSTARGWGGCARSCTTIMKHLLQEGYKVEFIPFREKVSSREYLEALRTYLKDVIVTEGYHTVHEACDVFFMYADDYVWELKSPAMTTIFENINATRKVMMLNYKNDKVGVTPWTRDWDKYMFLNSTQEQDLLKVHPGVNTKVLPPCTELEPFLKVEPTYNGSLRIVRHSSQGNAKFDEAKTPGEIASVLASREDVTIDMLPGPSYVEESERFKKHFRTDKPEVIADFLSKGNLFWYSLPEKYTDMGPRVIMEAMAAGLPVLADNRSGAKDRVTSETGWLCDTKEEQLDIIKNVSFEEIEKKGKAARERAENEFVLERWIKEVCT